MDRHITLKEKIVDAFRPSILVISTTSAYEMCKINNLTPAEMLRPFGEISGGEIKIEEQNVIRLRKFHFHFLDCDHLRSRNAVEIGETLKNVMEYYSPSFPFPDAAFLNMQSCNEMKGKAIWHRKFLKSFRELSAFIPNEYLSSPISLLYVYITKDNIAEEHNQIKSFLLKKCL